MISTRDLGNLPSISSLRRLTRALAMLDAILSPEWQDRYYSFDSAWGDGEAMASMRDGHGDHWFALFCSAGVAIHGLAHEAPMFNPGQPWPGIFDDLPSEFHDNLLREPAFDTGNSTFCIWRLKSAEGWTCGQLKFPPGADPDGSAELLEILEGLPSQYVRFASEYYERELEEKDVAAVYAHTKLTPELVARLNPEVSLELLSDDVLQIGYPERG